MCVEVLASHVLAAYIRAAHQKLDAVTLLVCFDLRAIKLHRAEATKLSAWFRNKVFNKMVEFVPLFGHIECIFKLSFLPNVVYLLIGRTG